MNRAARVASLAGLGALFVFAASGTTQAATAKQKEIVQQIESLNTAAVASYRAGDPEKARSTLIQALVLGKKNDLDTHVVLARTYLDMGIVQLEGLQDPEKAQRYFRLAVRIYPDIDVPPGMVTPAVTRELERVREGGASSRPAADENAGRPVSDDTRTQEQQDRMRRDLAQTQDGERREREAREKLQKAMEDSDRLLVTARESEKREREARERLAKEKLETEKQLVAVSETVRKEREAREKLERQLAETREAQQKERQLAEAREKERKSREDAEKHAREKLAEGPDMPSEIPQPLYCPTADEAQQGTDIFVHCVVQPGVKAKAAALYYRPSGVLHFNSLAMERSRKGWYVAVIPAGMLATKVMQYYVEGRNDRGEVVASYGKAGSPNIMTLRPPGTPVASGARPVMDASLVPASALESTAPPVRARTSARRTRAKTH
jgi:tetratricopeptide (TPR) repeat protein